MLTGDYHDVYAETADDEWYLGKTAWDIDVDFDAGVLAFDVPTSEMGNATHGYIRIARSFQNMGEVIDAVEVRSHPYSDGDAVIYRVEDVNVDIDLGSDSAGRKTIEVRVRPTGAFGFVTDNLTADA